MFNHNLETVPSNYLTVRPGARYFHSIRLLQRVKELDPSIFTKSGIMVGLGEERNEILQLMDDLRSADVDFMTIGQYLQPSKKHHPVKKFVTPEEFKSYETIGKTKGFLLVASSPLTRSSHHAGEDFAKLRAAREAQLEQIGLDRLDSCRNSKPRRRVGHTPEEMFALVADVEKYPEFLPLCEALTVRSRKERDGPHRARRRHDRRLQGDPRDLHQPGASEAGRERHRREISRRPVPLPQQHLALRAGRRRRLATSISSSTTSSRAAFSAP